MASRPLEDLPGNAGAPVAAGASLLYRVPVVSLIRTRRGIKGDVASSVVAAGGVAGLAGVLETTAFAPLWSDPDASVEVDADELAAEELVELASVAGAEEADELARPASPRRFSRSRIDKTSVEVDADELAAEELVELASVAGAEDADELAEGELAELAEAELVELAVDSWARRANSSSIDSIRSIALRVGGGRRRSKRPGSPSPRSGCYLKAAVTAGLRSEEGGRGPGRKARRARKKQAVTAARETGRHSRDLPIVVRCTLRCTPADPLKISPGGSNGYAAAPGVWARARKWACNEPARTGRRGG